MNRSVVAKMLDLNDRPALFSFLFSAALIVTLCLVFTPRWETSDDVCISMAAHGYGIAAKGSPNLLNYSNVLWGHIVRSIPSFGGVLGYSWATVASLFLIGWALFYFLLRLGAGYWASLFMVSLVMMRSTLVPQFTVNAGLFTVVAVMGWRVYARFQDRRSLWIACALAFLGYLIREKAFLLVLGVSGPLLPWKELRQQRVLQIALAVLAFAIVAAAVMNGYVYRGPEWKAFLEMDSTVPFRDHGAGRLLKQRPDILLRHGYSKNDIDLISASFFPDRRLTDAQALNAMVAELVPIDNWKKRIKKAFDAVAMLASFPLLVLLLPGLFFLCANFQWSVLFSWALCVAALFAIGITGHPAVLRVYFPLASLLLVAPVMAGQRKEVFGRRSVGVVLAVICLCNTIPLVLMASQAKKVIRYTEEALGRFPSVPVVIWGHYFPFETYFPVFQNDPARRRSRIARFNAIDYAPFSAAAAAGMVGQGMIDRWCSAGGIPIMTSEDDLHLLEIYCRERLKGTLEGVKNPAQSAISAQLIRCDRGR